MPSGMTRLFSAGKYAGALDAYVDYLKNMERRGTRVGTKGNRDAPKDLFASPFGIPLPGTVLLECGTTVTSWDKLKTAVGARTKETIPDASTAIKLNTYKFPRVSLRTGIATQGVAKVSARTKMKYLDYGGKTHTAPFGKVNNNDTIVGEFEEMKTLLNPSKATTIRVYLIPEKV